MTANFLKVFFTYLFCCVALISLTFISASAQTEEELKEAMSKVMPLIEQGRLT